MTGQIDLSLTSFVLTNRYLFLVRDERKHERVRIRKRDKVLFMQC